MPNNIDRLGNAITDKMKKISNAAVPTFLELGKVNSDMSISTDSMPVRIPIGDYMVNITLNSPTYNTSTQTLSYGHTHDHRLPNNFRSLQSGDRILVAWCGYQPVVLAIISSS